MEFSDEYLNITPLSDDDYLIQRCDNAKNDYLEMINDVHTLLENCKDLSNEQKLYYCSSERNFMKQYLKYALIKINKCFPE